MIVALWDETWAHDIYIYLLDIATVSNDTLCCPMISGFHLLLRISFHLHSPPDVSMFQHVWSIPRQVLQKASAVLTRDPTLAAIAFEAEEEEAPPQKPAPKAYPTPAPAAGTPAPPPVVSKAPVVSTAPARPGLGAATPAPKTGIFGSSPAPGGRNPLFEDTKRGDKLFDWFNWWPRGFHKFVSLVEVSLKKKWMEESGTANGPICRANLAEEEVEVASVWKEQKGARISKSMMAKGSNSREVLSHAVSNFSWDYIYNIIYLYNILYHYIYIYISL